MDEYLLIMAEAHATSEIEAGLRRVRSQLPKQPANFDGLCVECDEPIPEKRIKFGAITCLECQERLELQKSRVATNIDE